MPSSSLFADMDRSGSGPGDALDEQRALQIALDQLSLLGLDNDDSSLYDNEPRKKSVNMTECVPVPSSEHVAEIVGRQGEPMFPFQWCPASPRLRAPTHSHTHSDTHTTQVWSGCGLGQWFSWWWDSGSPGAGTVVFLLVG